MWNALGGVPISVSAFWHQMTHTTYALCVWAKSTLFSVLEGMECVHCELFSLGKLRSRLSVFSRELGQSSAPHGSGPAVAEAARRLRLWGSQMELADEFERGIKILRSSEADESKLLDEDVLCLTSSDVSALPLFLSFLSLSAPHMKRCWKLWSMLLLG